VIGGERGSPCFERKGSKASSLSLCELPFSPLSNPSDREGRDGRESTSGEVETPDKTLYISKLHPGSFIGFYGKKKIGHSFPIYLTPTDQGGGRLGRDPHSVYLE